MRTFEVQWIPQDVTLHGAKRVTRAVTHRLVEADDFEIEEGRLLFWSPKKVDETTGNVVATSQWVSRRLVAAFDAWDCVREVASKKRARVK